MPPKKRTIKQIQKEDPTNFVRRSSRNSLKPKVDYSEKKDDPKEFEESSSDYEESSDQESVSVVEIDSDQDMANDETKKTKRVKKGKKEKKAPKTRKRKFKKGKWNPNIEIVKYDLYKNAPDKNLKVDDSVRMSNLNAIRAVFTEDLKLMEKVFFDKQNISTLNAYWSPDIKLTALDYMALRNQTELLKIIINPALDIELHQTYADLRADFYQNRAS